MGSREQSPGRSSWSFNIQGRGKPLGREVLRVKEPSQAVHGEWVVGGQSERNLGERCWGSLHRVEVGDVERSGPFGSVCVSDARNSGKMRCAGGGGGERKRRLQHEHQVLARRTNCLFCCHFLPGQGCVKGALLGSS